MFSRGSLLTQQENSWWALTTQKTIINFARRKIKKQIRAVIVFTKSSTKKYSLHSQVLLLILEINGRWWTGGMYKCGQCARRVTLHYLWLLGLTQICHIQTDVTEGPRRDSRTNFCSVPLKLATVFSGFLPLGSMAKSRIAVALWNPFLLITLLTYWIDRDWPLKNTHAHTSELLSKIINQHMCLLSNSRALSKSSSFFWTSSSSSAFLPSSWRWFNTAWDSIMSDLGSAWNNNHIQIKGLRVQVTNDGRDGTFPEELKCLMMQM